MGEVGGLISWKDWEEGTIETDLCAEGSNGLDCGSGSESEEWFLGICAPGILGTGGNAPWGSKCEFNE
jgi:hypothetical protein